MALKEELPAFLSLGHKFVRKFARQFAEGDHPYLKEQDLAQDGFEALLQVWNRLYPQMELHDLVGVGRTAVYRRLRDRRKQSWTHGVRETTIVSLETPVGENLVLHDVVDSGVVDAYSPFRVQELLSCLNPAERLVLRELVVPSESVQAQQRIIETNRRTTLKPGKWTRISKSGSLWKGLTRDRAIASALGLDTGVVTQAIRHIRKEAKKIFQYSPDGPYREVEETGMECSKRRTTMEEIMPTASKGFVPDDDIALGMGTEPVTEKPAPKKEKVEATPKGNNGKAGKKVEAKKAEKPAPKKEEAKKPAPKKVDAKKKEEPKEEPKAAKAAKKAVVAWENGTPIKLLPGSRCGKAKAGAVGVVTAQHGNPAAPRYGVCFGEGDKAVRTVIAGKWLEKVGK